MPRHVERRHLPYTAQQLFDLVADVEKYPQFVDHFVEAHVRHRHGNVLSVEQVVCFAMLRLRFLTTTVLDPPREIVVTTTDPRFDAFEQRWRFAPAADGGTEVEYDSIVELHAHALQHLAHALIDERQMAEQLVLAFKRRARQIYGGPQTKTPVLS